MPSSHL
jgi:hypothetical protein